MAFAKRSCKKLARQTKLFDARARKEAASKLLRSALGNDWRRRRPLALTFSLAQLRNGNARRSLVFRDLDNSHCQQHCTGNSKKHFHRGTLS